VTDVTVPPELFLHRYTQFQSRDAEAALDAVCPLTIVWPTAVYDTIVAAEPIAVGTKSAARTSTNPARLGSGE
jgi:hypothetical protein